MRAYHRGAMDAPTRRAFVHAAVGSLLGMALVQQLARADAIRGSLKSYAHAWMGSMDETCAALRSGSVTPREWQVEIERQLARVDRHDLQRAIDVDRLSAQVALPDQHEGLMRVTLLDAQGKAQALQFQAFLFALKKGVAVVPHGHHNMATMHMLLSGEVHLRHFDRVGDGPTHTVLRPASDRVARPGDVSTVSDDRDNVHWFRALTHPVFMFNIAVSRVDPARPSGERDYVDPLAGVAMGDGLLRAPRLARTEAYARYATA
jgi:hypothetical protein